ncbi:MAG: YoaK family protein [Solirubrobacteraceae bacterium]
MSETAASAEPVRFDQEALGRAARSIQHPLARALLVLTFTTGLIDAVSFLGLGRVFTANMTGNIVFLGFGIAGSGGLPVVAPLVSLGSFLLGAGGGGVLAERMGDRHPAHIARALAVEVSLIGMAAVLAAAVDVRPSSVSGDVVIALLASAMGVRNATVRRLGVPDLTTTVLTMTLTGLAADSPAAGGSGKGSARRVAAVLAMLTGALAGALLLKTSLVLPLVAAAGLALVTWLVYVPAARRGA